MGGGDEPPLLKFDNHKEARLGGHVIRAFWNANGRVMFDLHDVLIAAGQSEHDVWEHCDLLGQMLYQGHELPPISAGTHVGPTPASIRNSVLGSNFGAPLHSLLFAAEYLNVEEWKFVSSTEVAASYLRAYASTVDVRDRKKTVAVVVQLMKLMWRFAKEVRNLCAGGEHQFLIPAISQDFEAYVDSSGSYEKLSDIV